MGFLREMAFRIDFRSRGASRIHTDLVRLEKDISKMQRGVGGKRAMAISYGAEQAATQLERVSRYARQGIQATAGLAADFEDQMGRVAALSTRGMSEGEAAKTVQALSKKARDLGASTRYTAKEAGEGMEFLAMAGFDAAKQMGTIPAVLNLATIGHVEVAKAADISTNIMAGFGLEADKSTMMVDRLASALTIGNVNLQELGTTMKYAAPMAKGLGQQMESMLGWADVLGDAGLKGSTAGTGMRSILISLSSPKKAAKQVFKDYGVELADKDGNLRDATDIMSELGLAMARSGKGNTELSAELTDVFGKRFVSHASVLMAAGAKGLATQYDDLSVLQTLLGDSGIKEDGRAKVWDESLQSRIGKVKESDGLGKSMAEKMDATTKGQWRAFKSALEETGITLGEQVLPILIDIMNEVKPVIIDVAKWAKKHSGAVKFLAKAGLLFVGITAVLTPLLHIFSAIMGLGGLGGRVAGGFMAPALGAAGAGSSALGGIGGGPRGGGGGGGGGGGYFGPYGGSGRGGRGRRPRAVKTPVALGPGQYGPAQYEDFEVNEYTQERGWYEDPNSGRLGWNAGRNSPDGVWASSEAAYTQEQRTKHANRNARAPKRGSLARAKWEAEQGRRRQEAKRQRQASRRQAKANRKAAGRGAGGRGGRGGGGRVGGAMQKAGLAAMAWGLGEAGGEAVNWASDKMFDRTATDFLVGGLERYDAWGEGGMSHWLRKRAGTETGATLGMSNNELNALHGGITGRRGGAQLLTDISGPTAESEERLSQMKRELELARKLGVTHETIRRAQAQGMLGRISDSPEVLSRFVEQEQAKDARLAQEEEDKRRKQAQVSLGASQAGAIAQSKGWTASEAHARSMHAMIALEGKQYGGLFGAFGDEFAAKMKAAVMEGITDGASKSKIAAIVPGVDAMTGAEAGG